MQVRIITCCPEQAALYANLLVFRSLRVGFPTAHVVVTDNGSRPWARVRIMEAAQQCGAEMRVTERRPYGDLIAQLFSEAPDAEPLALVDPDICFWENVEQWRFAPTILLAGRLIPAHRCDVEQCVIHRRFHTSFLWMPDPRLLRLAWPAVTDPHGWRQVRWSDAAGEKHLWDNGTALYAGLEPAARQAFDEAQLDSYEHLFGGTEAARFLPLVGDDFQPHCRRLHDAAREGQSLPTSLRGAWRIQDRYFAARRVSEAEHSQPEASR
jgi:hypothetical protein